MIKQILMCFTFFVLGGGVSGLVALSMSRSYSVVDAEEQNLKYAREVIEKGILAAQNGDWTKTQVYFQMGVDVREKKVPICLGWNNLTDPVGVWVNMFDSRKSTLNLFYLSVVALSLEKQNKFNDAEVVYEKLERNGISKDKARSLAGMVIEQKKFPRVE